MLKHALLEPYVCFLHILEFRVPTFLLHKRVYATKSTQTKQCTEDEISPIEYQVHLCNLHTASTQIIYMDEKC
jgi:hypothetical protein